MAAALRSSFVPLIQSVAGTPPRPIRLIRQLGIDKSLASRLVQAVRAEDDARFLHACPSPIGLRMVLTCATGILPPEVLQAASGAVDRFEDVMAAVGGRQGLDAQLGKREVGIRRKRENLSRQASFKALSFIFKHYCDHVVTAMFVVPSESPGKVDFIEVHRRLGIVSLASDAPIALMSLQPVIGVRPETEACIATLSGDTQSRRPEDFLLADGKNASRAPVSVIDEGPMTTFVLQPSSATDTGDDVTSAMRVLRAKESHPDGPYVVPRRYMLNTPCRTLTRDIYVAEEIWPDAQLSVDFYIPGPTGSPAVDTPPGVKSHRKIQLTCDAERLPTGTALSSPLDVRDHADVLNRVLAAAGQAERRFRGWRCTMAYPVPLIEMQIGFVFG